jgi:hypothetical protein
MQVRACMCRVLQYIKEGKGIFIGTHF